MKNYLKILIFMALIIIICSCNDIINSDRNLIKVFPATALSKDDSLSLINTTVIDLDTVKIPGNVNKSCVFDNQSDTVNIKIYKMVLKSGKDFRVQAAGGLPVLIPAKGNNSANLLMITFNSSGKAAGDYADSLYFNDSQKFYISLHVVVVN